MTKAVLKLFVTGRTPRSDAAIANTRRLCAHRLADECELIIVDVLEEPQVAENERIIATPTLVVSIPPNARRIIGDLSDENRVLDALGLTTR